LALGNITERSGSSDSTGGAQPPTDCLIVTFDG